MSAMLTAAASAPLETLPCEANGLGAGRIAGDLPPVKVSPASEFPGSIGSGCAGGGGDGLCTGCRKTTV